MACHVPIPATTKLDPKGLFKGVDPRLVAVMKRAYELYPQFKITCGLRTKAEQAALFKANRSKTMNSYHLTGRAVDIVVINPDKTANWQLSEYRKVNVYVQKAARELGVRITWGGVWKSIVDGPHFQIES